MLNERLSERYTIQKKIGSGTYSTTYQAHDDQTNKMVILKELQFGMIDNWKAHELFERETKALKQIDHPGIPDLIDSFEVQDDNDYRIYLVMQKVPGQTLANKLNNQWTCSEDEARHILRQLLFILEYLHHLNPPMIHRDIKPSNLILDDAQRLYLIDFGAVQETLKPEGQGGSTMIGTYGYMAPEQFSGRALPSSDLYAVGATLIHLLTETSPAQLPQRALKIQFKDYLPEVSQSFLDLLERLVEPDPRHRFQSVQEVREDLATISRPSNLLINYEEDKLTIQVPPQGFSKKLFVNSLVCMLGTFLCFSSFAMFIGAFTSSTLFDYLAFFSFIMGIIFALLTPVMFLDGYRYMFYHYTLEFSPDNYSIKTNKKVSSLGSTDKIRTIESEPFRIKETTGRSHELPPLISREQQEVIFQEVSAYFNKRGLIDET